MTTIINPAPDVRAVAVKQTESSYVDFSAAFAGALLAMAVSFVLLAFGASVGFSALSPWTITSTGSKALSLGAAFWVLLVEVWAFALGGYISARMRHRWHDAVSSEVAFRDGAHGLLVWALAIVISGIVAFGLSGGRLSDPGVRTTEPYRVGDPYAAVLDPLFRPAGSADVKTERTPNEVRGEAARILAGSLIKDGVPSADRAYLTRSVMAYTGVAQNDADARINVAIQQVKDAATKLKRLAVGLGFLTAASLLIGAAAAWWAAAIGGKHRDEGTFWHGFGEYTSS